MPPKKKKLPNLPIDPATLQRVLQQRFVSLTDLGLDYLTAPSSQQIAEALETNNAVAALDLSSPDLSPDWTIRKDTMAPIATLLKRTKTLTYFKIDTTMEASAAKLVAEALKVNTSLRVLNLNENCLEKGAMQEIAAALKVNSGLIELGLSSTDLKDAKTVSALAAALETNRTLRTLNLSNVGLGRSGPSGAQKIAAALHNNPILTWLDVGSNDLEGHGLAPILSTLDDGRLSSLVLKDNVGGPGFSKAVAAALSKSTSLTFLDLSAMALGLDDEAAQLIAEALQTNVSLTSITLNSNYFTCQAATSIASCLRVNRTLKELSLRRNEIEEDGFEELISALHCNDALRCLNLAFNGIDSLAFSSLQTMLAGNCSLTSLNLKGCGRWDDPYNATATGFQHLGYGLMKNTSLTHLDISNRDIGDSEVELLVLALENNSTLTSLHLSVDYDDEGFTQVGAARLCNALKSNTSLVDLGSHFGRLPNDLPHDIRAAHHEIRSILEKNKVGVKVCSLSVMEETATMIRVSGHTLAGNQFAVVEVPPEEPVSVLVDAITRESVHAGRWRFVSPDGDTFLDTDTSTATVRRRLSEASVALKRKYEELFRNVPEEEQQVAVDVLQQLAKSRRRGML